MVRWRFLQVAKKLPITFFASAGTAERKQPPACRSGCRLPITPPLRGGVLNWQLFGNLPATGTGLPICKLATFWQLATAYHERYT